MRWHARRDIRIMGRRARFPAADPYRHLASRRQRERHAAGDRAAADAALVPFAPVVGVLWRVRGELIGRDGRIVGSPARSDRGGVARVACAGGDESEVRRSVTVSAEGWLSPTQPLEAATLDVEVDCTEQFSPRKRRRSRAPRAARPRARVWAWSRSFCCVAALESRARDRGALSQPLMALDVTEPKRPDAYHASVA